MQGWHRLPVDGNFNGSGDGIMRQPDVIPMAARRECCRAALGAYAHALAAIHVKDAVVHRLHRRRIRGEVSIVEVGRITIRQDDQQ